MTTEQMIEAHLMKIFWAAFMLFVLSCVGVAYILSDKWKAMKKRLEEEAMRDEWLDETQARWKCEYNELPY